MSVHIRSTVSTVLATVVVAGMFLTGSAADLLPRVAVAPTVLAAYATGPVLSECTSCHGSDWCRHCGGTGAAGGNPDYSHGKSCHSCGGTGTCQDCLEPEPLVLIPGGKR